MSYVPQHRDRLVAAARRVADEEPAPRARRVGWGRLSPVLLAALLVACVPAVVIGATIIAQRDVSPADYRPGDGRPPDVDRHPGLVAGAPPSEALLRHFTVLRRPERPDDRFAPGQDVGAPRYFADQIRRVEPRPPVRGPGRAVKGTLRVAGAPRGQVCLLFRTPRPGGWQHGPGGTCATPSWAASGRAFIRTGRALYGLVPDGVREVRVTLVDHRVSVLPVAGNVFSAELPAFVRRFDFDGPGGHVRRILMYDRP